MLRFRFQVTLPPSRNVLLSCLLGMLLAFPLACFAQRVPPSYVLLAAPPTLPKSDSKVVSSTAEEWLGLYFGQKKIGYSFTRTTPAIYNAKPALKESGHSVTRLLLLGANIEEDETSETITDLKHRPLKQTLNVFSNGSALHVEAIFDYGAGKVFCKVGSGADSTRVTRKTLEIPPGANLAADTNTLTEGQALAVGKQLKFYYLQPLSIELQPAILQVTGRSTVKNDVGEPVSAFEVHADLPEGKMVGWAGADGNLIKSELRLGTVMITMVKESRQHALDANYISQALSPSTQESSASPLDFADATALKPDRSIAYPRRLLSLKATVSGIPEQNVLPSDARQTEERLTGSSTTEGVTARISVRAERFEAAEASQWPVQDPSLTPYLTKAAYLETNDTEIQQTAVKLRGKETNLYRIASRIRDWVHSVMTPDPSIAVLRSAKDVYGRRRGVCRDYATLYTAVARAAGVPTRLCAGIVYGQGKFFYHAWAESFVGKWVAFDPTLYDPKDADYVDATHIKFAQGDVTQMVNVVSIIGRLKIHLIEADPALDDGKPGAGDASF